MESIPRFQHSSTQKYITSIRVNFDFPHELVNFVNFNLLALEFEDIDSQFLSLGVIERVT